MSAPNLKFKVQEIQDKQGLSCSLSVPPHSLLKETIPEARLAGPIAVNLDFSVGGNRILLQARVTGAWIVPCKRSFWPGSIIELCIVHNRMRKIWLK